MRHHLRNTLVASAFVLVIMSALPAFAAEKWQGVDVTLHPSSEGSLLLVSGELPEDAKLPAEVELSVPAGAKLQWIGEILGGPAADDPELTYTKRTADGVDVYTVTLTKARQAQIEVVSPVVPFDGKAYAPAISWTSAQDVPEVWLTARVPEGSKLFNTPEGLEQQAGRDGYDVYGKRMTDVKAGEKLDLSFSYTMPTVTAPAGAATAPSQSSSDGTLIAVLVVVIAGIAVAIGVLSRRKTAQPEAVAGGAQDDDDAGEALPATTASNPSRATKRRIATFAVIGALVLVVVIVGNQGTKPKVVGGTMTQTFVPGDACTTANIAIKTPENGDQQKAVETVFAALQAAGGINNATFNPQTSSIQVGFCDSQTTEEAVRTAIANTGLLGE